MSDLVFMDTETLGLELDSPIWEFAAIRREPGGQESRLHMFINHNPARMSIDLPESFRADYEKRWQAAKDGSLVAQPHNAALRIVEFMRGRPTVVGAVPDFDTVRISRQLLQPAQYDDPWHYHLVDVENVIVGYLAGHLWALRPDRAAKWREQLMPPWSSDGLSSAVGVDPEQFERHTALGDVRWVMAQWDAVMGGNR